MHSRAKVEKKIGKKGESAHAELVSRSPRSLAIAEKGIASFDDLVGVSAALVRDVIAGDITHNVCNAACRSLGTITKSVELQIKIGKPAKKSKLLLGCV